MKAIQKMMFLISVIVIGSLLFISQGYSQNLNDAEAEKISLKKQASLPSETVNPSNFNADNFINILNETFSKGEGSQRSKRSAWYSTDSKDLSPLIGTTWIIGYKIGSSFFSDALTFGTQVVKTSSGYVALSVSNKNGETGSVFYSDLVQGGRGFATVIDRTSIISFYSFKINDNMADGVYDFKDVATGDYTDMYSLIGVKWGSDSGTANCVSMESNLDLNVPCLSLSGNKYGFVLNHVTSSTYPFGYYWKLDVNSITQK